MVIISPSSYGRLSGMPWQTTSLTLVQHDFGKPRKPKPVGQAPWLTASTRGGGGGGAAGGSGGRRAADGTASSSSREARERVRTARRSYSQPCSLTAVWQRTDAAAAAGQRGNGFVEGSRHAAWATASISSVVTPGATALHASSSTAAATAPAARRPAMSRSVFGWRNWPSREKSGGVSLSSGAIVTGGANGAGRSSPGPHCSPSL